MITKKEANGIVNEIDRKVVENYVAQIDRALRANWNGSSEVISTGKQKLKPNIVNAVKAQVEDAGWNIQYYDGGDDQRDGPWPGKFVIT